ncbi:MAG: indolepyruvate ferredoxin oxidoreductase subunit alpha [Clostridia bacterium]|nr:indolepyruvate ferredoxin oxidoreductase subunit alpha [Clostridia bacterium]
MKKLMLGNAAVARGAYEAGVKVVSSYPGTPSTEITENIVKYEDVYVEWAPNEKVACETAIGASIAGARAMTCMKHVGLNVMADPVFTVSYIGANGGLVLCVADDPGMHSSQNEQDSRHYAKASKIPMLEPSNSSECKEYTKLAFELSEQFDVPVFIRLSTRVSHSQSLVEEVEPNTVPLKPYEKNIAKNVMMPANAIKRHVVVEEREEALREYAETSPLNVVENNGAKIGVITSGVTYQYAKEALKDSVNYLKLGMVYPLPTNLIKEFAKGVETLYVLEELDPFIEEFVKALGITVKGKSEFSLLGEYSQGLIRKVVLGKTVENLTTQKELPKRPPVMCAGCPHRGTFYVLNKLKVTVSGDIGCYTLGAVAPLSSVDTTICMGASISSAHGMVKARGKDFSKKLVAVIGDSTFMHSGITGLIDVVYNKNNNTVIILDNSITGMTGHQENPTTGLTIRNEPTKTVDLVALCKAVGVDRVRVEDPFDVKGFETAVKEELSADEPSVIIARRPCALLKGVKYEGRFTVKEDKCRSCKMCMKLGCPAITYSNGKAKIDATQCNGCGLCANVCPFEAIEKENN